MSLHLQPIHGTYNVEPADQYFHDDALAALTMTQQNLNQVENQVSTGLAIANAPGNPASCPIATKMTSDAGALGAVNNALGDSQSMVSTMSSALNSTSSVLDAITPGATTASLTTEQNDVSNLSDSLTTGVGSLVDASMNEAATKVAALQVQQQLGVQALSISNSNTQLILKLFRL